MPVRSIRGAITVAENTKKSILEGTHELLVEIIKRNGLDSEDIISVIFSVTHDLNAAFPAVAAREIGWKDISLMCTNEINVPDSLKSCIRVLIHFNTEKANNEINHVYLKGAKILRPDISAGG
ncbi:chorismate mutase [Ruminiclostridium sufflavum DSM 19573]|uniref:chorismate mutase n=1 Tax=Ruminiclostridium sufflavum DSM 19573 TaxID=1121337 RepID=A0A318XLR5_9FIRM|nr:chorismate mutase [Ruminiclostridium sufflavum]PYG87576.1 chorismate mutase [Ruminiclostridium sufflavum DSM 19573]